MALVVLGRIAHKIRRRHSRREHMCGQWNQPSHTVHRQRFSVLQPKTTNQKHVHRVKPFGQHSPQRRVHPVGPESRCQLGQPPPRHAQRAQFHSKRQCRSERAQHHSQGVPLDAAKVHPHPCSEDHERGKHQIHLSARLVVVQGAGQSFDMFHPKGGHGHPSQHAHDSRAFRHICTNPRRGQGQQTCEPHCPRQTPACGATVQLHTFLGVVCQHTEANERLVRPKSHERHGGGDQPHGVGVPPILRF